MGWGWKGRGGCLARELPKEVEKRTLNLIGAALFQRGNVASTTIIESAKNKCGSSYADSLKNEYFCKD